MTDKVPTQSGTTGWTVETLKEYVDQRFDASQKAVEAALQAAEKMGGAALASADRAVSKAEVAAEKRFDATNEFRGQQKDMITTLFPRMEAEQRFNAFDDRLKKVEEFRDRMSGGEDRQTSMKNTTMWAVGLAIATIIAIVTVILKH